jgi:hypothetical protein
MKYIGLKGIILLSFFIATVCVSCKNKELAKDYPILKIDLQEQSVSILDVFKSVNIIPLETTRESVFQYPSKIEIRDETIFVFDRSQSSLLMFRMDGRYIDKIHKVGRGPGEYLMACDFLLNNYFDEIRLLDPTGSIYIYDINGNFINKEELPVPPYNYHNLEMLDNSTYITWSREDFGNNGVNIINAKSLETQTGFFPNTGLWGGFRMGSVFHKYANEVYYYESMSHKVYHFTSKGYEIAYEWDTGVKIVDQKKLLASESSINDVMQELLNYVVTGEIPYFYALQSQTDNYYYAMLLFNNDTFKYILRDKHSDKNIFFSKTTEGINPYFLQITNDYAIGIIRDTDTEGLQKVVSPEDAELLRNRKEDDNWWLVKYTFK